MKNDTIFFQEIHGSDDVFRLLVHSLCPTIFGHEAVKAGLILGLLGGTEHENGPRSNPHILVVGDPGLGKSQLLQAAAHAAPRGEFCIGKHTTLHLVFFSVPGSHRYFEIVVA